MVLQYVLRCAISNFFDRTFKGPDGIQAGISNYDTLRTQVGHTEFSRIDIVLMVGNNQEYDNGNDTYYKISQVTVTADSAIIRMIMLIYTV